MSIPLVTHLDIDRVRELPEDGKPPTCDATLRLDTISMLALPDDLVTSGCIFSLCVTEYLPQVGRQDNG